MMRVQETTQFAEHQPLSSHIDNQPGLESIQDYFSEDHKSSKIPRNAMNAMNVQHEQVYPTALPTPNYLHGDQQNAFFNWTSSSGITECPSKATPRRGTSHVATDFSELYLTPDFKMGLEAELYANANTWVNPLLTPIEPLTYNLEEICSSSVDLLSSDEFIVNPSNQIINDPERQLEVILTSFEEEFDLSTSQSPLFSEIREEDKFDISPSHGKWQKTNKQTRKRAAKRVKTKAKSRRPSFSQPLVNEVYVSVYDQIVNDTVMSQKISQIRKKGIYKCAHCSQVFPDLIQLALHLDEFKVVRPHKCPFADCPWSILGLPRKAEVRRHCTAQHEFQLNQTGEENSQGGEYFVCDHDKCSRVFKRKDSYRRHERLVHLTSTSRFNRRMEKLKNKSDQEARIEMERYIDVSDSAESARED
jgi:uncharacterized C2H2 Zn-finger protein